ncbi:ATP-binding protein [Rhodopila globiformis]|uniref:ATP-binding protein n=1 Tax=Rhodopila globiformis TaxID=1071 RepID=UPI001304F3C5|nr:AAA family ATPase [Rhodopila globiformis]
MILRFLEYDLDLAGHSLTGRTGTEIPLTPGEFRLLREFAHRPGRVLSRDDLLSATAGRDADPYDRSIDMLVVRLRRKIEPDPRHPSLIVTAPGAGYKFTARVTRASPTAQPEDGDATTAPEQRPAAPERRQLTVLQCVLSGPAFLAARRNLEDLHALLTVFHAHCAQIVRAAGGTVAQLLSDGMLAYFGYPQADEHQAERAIHAGLALVGPASQPWTGQPGGLHRRIGIASGLVVIGGSPGEPAVLGETVTYVARLAAHADADTVLVTTATRRLTGGLFCYRTHAPLVRDDAESLETWAVERPARPGSRFDRIRAGPLAPLIGREAELALLLERWDLAQGGEGQAVLLSGEPGIGKSRILKELRDRLERHRVESVRLQCSPHRVNSAYHPVIDNFARALKLRGNETPDARLDKLEGLMVGQYGLARADAGFIAAMLSIPCEHRYGQVTMTPQKAKDETLRVLVDVTEAIARRQPTVVLIEDVHWADPTTLGSIDLLVHRLAQIPLLLVLTHRPGFRSNWLNWGNVTAITLPKLTRAQSVRLIEGISHGTTLPPDLMDQILARADGVPLFIEEVTKSVLETVTPGDAGSRSRHAGATIAVGVPPTLRDSLMARLDRFVPMKEIAQVGAAIGREFDYELVAAVAPHAKAERDEALDRLVASGLASCKGTPPAAVYRFKHALVQDAAYDSLLRSQKQALHARIATVLEEHLPDLRQTGPELLAHHYTEAARFGQAVPLWHKAGRLAIRRMALTEAVKHLNRGLELIAAIAPSRERDSLELDLRTALGTAGMRLKGWQAEEVWASVFPALVLARSLDRMDALLPVLLGTFLHVLSAGRVAESLNWARQTLDVAGLYRDRNTLMQGHHAMLTGCFWAGDFVDCRHHAQQVLSLYDTSLDRDLAEVLNHDPKSHALHYLSKAAWILGYPDQAISINAAKEAHARQTGHPFDLAFTAATGAQIFNYLREPHQALARAMEGERLGEELGLPFFCRILAPIFRGMVLIRLNEAAEGTDLLRTSLAAWEAGGGRNGIPYCRSVLAEGMARLGCLDEALRLLDAAIQQVERPGWEERSYIAEILRIRGEVRVQTGDVQAAERDYRASLDWARRQQARSWELRTATSYARFMRDRGRTREAYDVLAPVHAWFTEGFGTRDLCDARALLRELAARLPHRRDGDRIRHARTAAPKPDAPTAA